MDAVKVSALPVLGPLFINDQMLSVGAISCVVSVRLCVRLVVDNVMPYYNHRVPSGQDGYSEAMTSDAESVARLVSLRELGNISQKDDAQLPEGHRALQSVGVAGRATCRGKDGGLV